MTEQSKLRFEAKPVPEGWSDELKEMRKKRNLAAEKAAIRAAIESKPLTASKLSRQEVLAYFATLQNTPEIVKLFVAGREQYERDPDSDPDPIIYRTRRDFADWWIRKYTRHYEYSNEAPIPLLERLVAIPIVRFARGQSRYKCIQEIEEAMDKLKIT